MPYRELDKTTVWFRRNVRNLLRYDDKILLATVIFRWFNRIETGRLLLDRNLLTDWDKRKAIRALQAQAKRGPVFTGAYMIKAGNGPPGCKIPQVCEAITRVAKEEERLVVACYESNTLEEIWKLFLEFPRLGKFMSYELVCDLRYTHLLRDATDRDTWTNLGPGGLRGLTRVAEQKLPKKEQLPFVCRLLRVTRRRLPNMPRFELREIEHSLCEFDKYERARLAQGKLKRRYNGNP